MVSFTDDTLHSEPVNAHLSMTFRVQERTRCNFDIVERDDLGNRVLSGTSEDQSSNLEEMILCSQDKGVRICQHILDHTVEAEGNSGKNQPESLTPSCSHAKDVLGGSLNGEAAQDSPIIDDKHQKTTAISALVQIITEFEDLLIEIIEEKVRVRFKDAEVYLFLGKVEANEEHGGGRIWLATVRTGDRDIAIGQCSMESLGRALVSLDWEVQDVLMFRFLKESGKGEEDVLDIKNRIRKRAAYNTVYEDWMDTLNLRTPQNRT